MPDTFLMRSKSLPIWRDLRGKATNRATRLCEFSAVGQLFSLSSFFLISSVVQILGLHFSSIEIMHLHIVAKNELGHILGDFFTSSSGHAGREYGRSGT
jgi:hypothetical protein